MQNNEKIRDWNPDDGDCLQGDIILFRLPTSIKAMLTQPIAPEGHLLILARGEVTGHHHAIWFNPPMFRDDAMAHTSAAVISGSYDEKWLPRKHGVAALYRDDNMVQELIAIGALTTDRLAIGLLVVEDASIILRHQEHDPICIPPGNYYAGRQREQTTDAERQVAD